MSYFDIQRYKQQIPELERKLQNEQEKLAKRISELEKRILATSTQNVRYRFSHQYRELDYGMLTEQNREKDVRFQESTGSSAQDIKSDIFDGQHFHGECVFIQDKSGPNTELELQEDCVATNDVNGRKLCERSSSLQNSDFFPNNSDAEGEVQELWRPFSEIQLEQRHKVLEIELSKLKSENEVLTEELEEINREIKRFHNQKVTLKETLVNNKKKEILLQEEKSELSQCMKKSRSTLCHPAHAYVAGDQIQENNNLSYRPAEREFIFKQASKTGDNSGNASLVSESECTNETSVSLEKKMLLTRFSDVLSQEFTDMKREIICKILEITESSFNEVNPRLNTLERNIQDLICTNENKRTLELSESKYAVKRNDYDNGYGDEGELNFLNLCPYNYFSGYLDIILPHRSELQNKGIIKRIEEYIANEGLHPDSFPVKKLFILVPDNLYIPPNLNELSIDFPGDGTKYWMERRKSLEPEVLYQNGGMREYCNSVYDLLNPDSEGVKPYKVVAEGPTPLKFIYDVQSNPKLSQIFENNQQEIVSQFYDTLHGILQESKCKDLCEIIYYQHVDMNGRSVNVGRLLLDRISKITKESQRQ